MKAKPTSLLLFTLLGILPAGFAGFHFTQQAELENIRKSQEEGRSQNAIVNITGGSSTFAVLDSREIDESAAVALLKKEHAAQESSIATAKKVQNQEAASQGPPKQKLKNTLDTLAQQFPPPSKEEVLKKVTSLGPFLPDTKATEADLSQLGATASKKDLKTLKARASKLAELSQNLNTLAEKKNQISPDTLAKDALKNQK